MSGANMTNRVEACCHLECARRSNVVRRPNSSLMRVTNSGEACVRANVTGDKSSLSVLLRLAATSQVLSSSHHPLRWAVSPEKVILRQFRNNRISGDCWYLCGILCHCRLPADCGSRHQIHHTCGEHPSACM